MYKMFVFLVLMWTVQANAQVLLMETFEGKGFRGEWSEGVLGIPGSGVADVDAPTQPLSSAPASWDKDYFRVETFMPSVEQGMRHNFPDPVPNHKTVFDWVLIDDRGLEVGKSITLATVKETHGEPTDRNVWYAGIIKPRPDEYLLVVNVSTDTTHKRTVAYRPVELGIAYQIIVEFNKGGRFNVKLGEKYKGPQGMLPLMDGLASELEGNYVFLGISRSQLGCCLVTGSDNFFVEKL